MAGQPSEALARPLRDGGWGAVENLCHLRGYRATRLPLVELLGGIAPEGWSRVGVDSVRGEITLRWLAELARDHAEEHLVQIREALG